MCWDVLPCRIGPTLNLGFSSSRSSAGARRWFRYVAGDACPFRWQRNGGDPAGVCWRAWSLLTATSNFIVRLLVQSEFKSHPLRMDSQAKSGAVARGEAVLYLRMPFPKHPDYREKVWDHAAGSLVVEEAGGRVTDMFDRPLDFGSNVRMEGNRGVVVSNGEVHDAVIEALAQAVVTSEEG